MGGWLIGIGFAGLVAGEGLRDLMAISVLFHQISVRRLSARSVTFLMPISRNSTLEI